jgi:hypothetical protein
MSTPAEAISSSNGAPGADPSTPSPAAAPTATPQQPKGEQAAADAGIQVALRFLERAVVAHGYDSKKGSSLRRAISLITAEFGGDEDRALAIMPMELKTGLMAPSDGSPAAPSTPQPPTQQAA